jgi:hypothetical protein
LTRLRLAARSLLLSSLFIAACCASARAQGDPVATPEPAQERVYTREEVTKPAVILSMPDPVLQRKLGKTLDVNGTVKVGVVLLSSGRIGEVEIIEGLSQAQNFASIKAAHSITFMPAEKNGRPVSQSIVAEYRFRIVTDEFGTTDELKGVSKFYVNSGGDRDAREEVTGELLRLMPSLQIVDRPEQAECIILFISYGRTDQPAAERNTVTGQMQYNAPLKVKVGRGWVVRPLAADRERVLMYYEDAKFSPVERKPSTNFARAFVEAYRKANSLPKQ